MERTGEVRGLVRRRPADLGPAWVRCGVAADHGRCRGRTPGRARDGSAGRRDHDQQKPRPIECATGDDMMLIEAAMHQRITRINDYADRLRTAGNK